MPPFSVLPSSIKSANVILHTSHQLLIHSHNKSFSTYRPSQLVTACYGMEIVQVTLKGFPYSLPSVGPGDDTGVQAVSPQVTISHPPGSRLPLLSARLAVTFLAAEHHRHLAGTKLYCLLTEAYRCEQLAQGCYAALPQVGFEPTTC